MAWTVRYLVAADGSMPAADFEDSLPPKIRAKLYGLIAATANLNGQVGSRIFKALHTVSGLYEVRAKMGIDLARSLCTRDSSNLILLTGVLKREEEETPASVIQEAVDLRAYYLETKNVNPPF